MSESFDRYEKIEKKVEENLMARVHLILMEIQSASLRQTKALEVLEKKNDEGMKRLDGKIDGILMHPLFTAWNTTTSGVKLFKYLGSAVLFIAMVWGAFKLLSLDFINEIIRHL